MVKHIVLWKLRDDADKQKNMDRMISELTSLVGKIEGLVSIEMGYNFNTANDYDVVLYAAFKNAAALKYYQTHPEHVKCKDFIEGITVARIAADYCFDEGVLEARPYNEVPDAPAEELPSMPKTAARAASRKIAADEAAAEAEASSFAAAPTPAPAPAPKAEPREDNRPSFFKKKVEIDVTPLDQRSDTWTCPSCGKVMPNYVGTCGCGEPKPFGFDDVPPALQPEPTVGQVKNAVSAHNTPAPAPKAAEPAKATAAKSAAKAEPKEYNRPSFFKKKVEIDVTPLDQRSDTWTCPSCGKVMPNYVGTCGCGEPKPFSFDDVPPALQPEPTVGQVKNAVSAHNTPAPAPKAAEPAKATAAKPAAKAEPKEYNRPSFFKKKVEIDVTPLDQRSDTWTCPSCGKVMPNYVGTCGCGESKPFGFDDVPPALQPEPTVGQVKNAVSAHNTPAPAPKAAEPAKATAAKPAAKAEPKEYNRPSFFKKKVEIDVTPLDQRSDTWTCPSCGKVMPNYVGTCGCGEPKPFSFDDVPPALQPEPTVGQVKNAVSAHNTPAPAPKAAEPAKAPAAKADTKDSGLPSFFKKKVEIDATPLNQRSDTWTCPSCGKIMPNYVGTCGCGEPKPFSFDDVPPALQPEPTVGQVRNAVSAHNTESRPTRRRVVQEEPAPQNTADTGFSSSNDDANGGFDFDNAPPPAPMRFDDAPPPAPMRFDDAPPPAPMRFEEEEDDSFNFNFDDAPPPAPMRFDDAPPAAPMRFEDNAPAAAAPKAPEKKHLFGKKAKEEEAMRRAEEAVNNRRDIPNSGSTWTCPNCGKVMPKYVGTCGCGEPQPFGD